ncbi:hypothetical protein GCM10010326_59280 [Streptomyces xanthochromogenes]|uniref:Uncharacterized protein n=1 Tax=Streptomyces xanthochromogenes TaxID=67384 RepID=A0ABQ3AL61_9ACTN|nr:hypothetical protein GCM10010326_59280 [Streptomyces xanthochromogenes]
MASCLIETIDENRLEGCRGFNGPYPSAPLDERYSIVSVTTTPDMRRSSALFKTVTEALDG